VQKKIKANFPGNTVRDFQTGPGYDDYSSQTEQRERE
jgi:hypothetical protein